jgi:hypothetical protein
MAEVSEIGITDGRANPLMDQNVVGAVFFGVVAVVAVVVVVAVVTWSVTSLTTAGCSVV